jgi:hypothetical protein
MPLRVETGVPYGNACDTEVVEEGGAAEVRFAADPHGGPECLWFCFRLAADGPPRGGGPPAAGRVRLVLKHPHNMLGVGRGENLRPVIRRPGSDWERLPGPSVEVFPDGRHVAAWTVPAPDPWLDLALCYPYGMPEVRRLVEETGGYWRADTIGVSQGARPIVRLSNSAGERDGKRPGLYLLARQHSGETPGSWVLDGVLRRMAARGPETPLVWAVPLANIDGVEQGDYGKDNFPYDLNRAWGHAPQGQPMRHEIMVIERDVRAWKERCRPMLGLDFHAPGGNEAAGAYVFVPDPKAQAERHRAAAPWLDLMARALGDLAAKDFARVARYPSRWTTPSFREFFESSGAPGLCLETPYAMVGERVLGRQDYGQMGRRLADGLAAQAATTV